MIRTLNENEYVILPFTVIKELEIMTKSGFENDEKSAKQTVKIILGIYKEIYNEKFQNQFKTISRICLEKLNIGSWNQNWDQILIDCCL